MLFPLEVSHKIAEEIERVREKDIFGKPLFSKNAAIRMLKALLPECQSSDDEEAVVTELSNWDLHEADKLNTK